MINMIKTTLLLIALGIGPQAADDPSGLWEVVETGVRFRIEQTDTGLRVTLGAEHPQLLEYEVNLESSGGNAYQGIGHFVAKLGEDRECRFDTRWNIALSTPNDIVGVASRFVFEEEGCGVRERRENPLQMTRIP